MTYSKNISKVVVNTANLTRQHKPSNQIFQNFRKNQEKLYQDDFEYTPHKGTICPTFTALSNDSYKIDLGQINDYAKDLVKQEVSGLFLTGTSGQSVLLSLEERKKV